MSDGGKHVSWPTVAAIVTVIVAAGGILMRIGAVDSEISRMRDDVNRHDKSIAELRVLDTAIGERISAAEAHIDDLSKGKCNGLR